MCTDGLANVGIGDLSSSHEKMLQFYRTNVAMTAKKSGVMISVVGISGSEARYVVRLLTYPF